MEPIQLIVGLGNPGTEHDTDRHNAGFWFVDAIARQAGTSFRPEKRFFGDLARARIQDNELWLLKPTTYMNRSGQSVSALARFHRIAPAQVLVVHDELDLPPGGLKLKRGGGSGGHNGLKDISAALGTPDYWRLRIGIGHPRDLYPGREVIDFVLARPSRAEQEAIDARMTLALEALPLLGKGEMERAGQVLHTVRKAAPPKP
ncbi:MAG: aminoacyl-tRNA hydrolase [Burkholderiales bacterium]|jgi:PTH1 family peptidyl-tRNA hydrolase